MAIKHCRWMAAGVAVFALSTVPAQAGKLAKMTPPRIGCGGATQLSTFVQVCGGSTGASAGFSVQWMTAADLAANGGAFCSSGEPRLCRASFSGRANGSRYDLGPGECVTVNIGDLLFDNGASTNCAAALVPGTDYVFRKTSGPDNGLVALAHQLIAAKLSIATGADGPAVAATIAAADGLVGGLVVPPVGDGSLGSGVTAAYAATLASFNEGAIGPGACPPPDPGEDQ